MSSSSDENIAAAYLLVKKRKKKTYRNFWGNPFYIINLRHSSYIVAQELNNDPVKFHGFYRMIKDTFKILAQMLKPEISRKDTNYRKAVSAEERLLITLRYLSTGDSYRALTYYFMRGLTTISYIIATTTEAIWTVLQPIYMSKPTQEKWRAIADRYHTLWNLPNCLGSLDGKHFRIKCPPRTGSQFYNYKGYFSIVLMACVDADGLFTTIDVGEIGGNSDGAVFRTSNLGRSLQLGLLDLPELRPLPSTNDDFPYYFVADEAFPLKNYLIRPYSKRTLDNRKRVFNYRLSRGPLVSKFRLFEGPICCKEETVNSVIKAACVLHNIIRIKQGKCIKATEFHANQDQVAVPINDMPQPQINRSYSEAQNIRERDFVIISLHLPGLYRINGITLFNQYINQQK